MFARDVITLLTLLAHECCHWTACPGSKEWLTIFHILVLIYSMCSRMHRITPKISPAFSDRRYLQPEKHRESLNSSSPEDPETSGPFIPPPRRSFSYISSRTTQEVDQESSRPSQTSYWNGPYAHLPATTGSTTAEGILRLFFPFRAWSYPSASWRKWNVL